MTARSVIPPVTYDGGHSQETVGLLQQRLIAAEDDTKDLANQLTQMGFKCAKENELGIPPISPYKARVGNLDQPANYEMMVARMCKMESAVQMVKLSLLRAQAERDLSKEEKMTANEKLSSTSDAYEKEIAKTSRELVQSRKDLKDVIEERRKLQNELSRLQENLDVGQSEKSEAEVMIEDLKSTKTKMTRRVNELRDELGRESSLRASLEESHNTLMTRIQEVEATVQHEQDEMKNLNTICSQLKRERLRAKEEAELERSLRLQAEDSLQKLTAQNGNVQSQINTLLEDKTYLMSEMTKMQSRYKDLIQQLDLTQALVNDKQCTHEQLEKENKRLYEAMKATASQNARLIAKYEEETESLKTQVVSKVEVEEKVKHLSAQLRVESREKGHAVTTNSHLNAKTQELDRKIHQYQLDLDEMKTQHQKEITELREVLKNREMEKEQIMKDKDALLDEVNQAVDEMVEERSHLQCQLQQAKIDQEAALQAHQQLKEENGRLLERNYALEEQANASGQIENALTEMMEQKNKLAYDKGRLQSRVKELQHEVENLADGQTELMQLRKVSSSTETNYKKSQTELNEARMVIQRFESRIKQQESSIERKEEDFRLAIQARDEAVKESQELARHIEEIENRQKQQVGSLERSLGDTRQDNRKVASTLESVMQSHTQLQFTIEGLQITLGKKDAQISHFAEERAQLQNRNKQLVKELENIQSKLVSVEALEENEVGPLRKVIEQCKSDNSKMASSLETVVKSNGNLQMSVENLKEEVKKKVLMMEQLQEVRIREQEAQQQKNDTYEKRLENMKDQLACERQKSLKKSSKEISEFRKQHEDLVSKNGDLSRSNTDLRHRITDLEYECKEWKEKSTSLRSQIDHLTKIRQKQEHSIKGFQAVGNQLGVLEHSNEEYVKKNIYQAQMIKKFMGQMTNLQEELKSLALAQADTATILQQQEDQLRRERMKNDELKARYKEVRKREKSLEELRRQTEEKLLEANNESLQISTNLTDAHSWFKSKFDSLQTELQKSRSHQAGLIHENYEQKNLFEEEQRKAQETAEKARQMIKASRETISRLADYAEYAQKETTSEMQDMYNLGMGEEYSYYSGPKLKGQKSSTLRHKDKLAQELDLFHSQNYLPSDSFQSSSS